MEEGRLPNEVMKVRLPARRKPRRSKFTWAEGIRGLMGEGRLERQTQLKEEDNVINKWAQEDMNSLNSLLNNDNCS
jgi:hypothetical protein